MSRAHSLTVQRIEKLEASVQWMSAQLQRLVDARPPAHTAAPCAHLYAHCITTGHHANAFWAVACGSGGGPDPAALDAIQAQLAVLLARTEGTWRCCSGRALVRTAATLRHRPQVCARSARLSADGSTVRGCALSSEQLAIRCAVRCSFGRRPPAAAVERRGCCADACSCVGHCRRRPPAAAALCASGGASGRCACSS